MGHLVSNTAWMNGERLSILMDGAVPSESHYRTAYDAGKQYPKGSVDIETGFFLYALIRRLRPECSVAFGNTVDTAAGWVGCALMDNVESWQHGTVNPLYVTGQRSALWTKLGIDLFIRDIPYFSEIRGAVNFVWADYTDIEKANEAFRLLITGLAPNCICAVRGKICPVPAASIHMDSIDGITLFGV